jgi:ketosteroid isomerase-like protein
VKAEIEAVNKGQVDVASSYFSDDAQIVTSIGQPKGKEKIRAFVFNLVQMKEHDEIVDLAADGTSVTGRMTLTDTALKAVPVNLKAVVEDGKIVSWEEGSAAK